jgi:asparagine synthase (glutamine-hydrolysing)
MSLLVGVLYRDPARPADAEPLRATASRVRGVPPVIASAGPFGVFLGGEELPWRGDGSVIVAGHLDLLNLDELRSETGRGAPQEVVAALYAREGRQAIRRLRGSFAVAVWDSANRRLLLAVDQVGMRRLYYAVTSEGLAFASGAGLLRGLAGLGLAPDATAVFDYLNFGYVPAPTSIYADVHRVEPGCLVTVEQGALTVSRYWDLAYAEQALDLDEAGRRTVQLSEAAVARSLGADGLKHTGAFLSGGTDSSTIVGLMTRLAGERVNAFSIGFHERRYDELGHAERAARHFGALHHVRRISAGQALEVLPELVEAYDEPFGNNSAIGTLLCARTARECGLTRLLAGDGGDEIFGGNERYATDAVFSRYGRIPRVVRRALLEPLLSMLPNGGATALGKAQRYVRRASLPNPRRFYSYEFFFAQEGRGLLAPGFLSAVTPEVPWTVLERHFDRVTAGEELNRLLYLDMKLTIGDNDLLKVVRTADAAGLDVRFPFLDLPLVEFTTSWPGRFKVRGAEKRYLFKRAFRDLLPAETLAKPKHGFGIPTSLWLRTHPGFVDLVNDALLAPDAHVQTYFRPGALEELMRLHASDSTAFYGDIVWKVLMLELWHRHHLVGREVRP